MSSLNAGNVLGVCWDLDSSGYDQDRNAILIARGGVLMLERVRSRSQRDLDRPRLVFLLTRRRLDTIRGEAVEAGECCGVSFLVDDGRRRCRLSGVVELSAAPWGWSPSCLPVGSGSGVPSASPLFDRRGGPWKNRNDIGTGRRSWCTPLIRQNRRDRGKIGGGIVSCRSMIETVSPGRSYSPPIHSSGGVVPVRFGGRVRYDGRRKKEDAVGRRLCLVLVAWPGVEVLLCLKV